MKYTKKIGNFLGLVAIIFFIVSLTQAKSFDYYKEKAHAGMESAWESAQSKLGKQLELMQKKASGTWNSIDPKVKRHIQNALNVAAEGVDYVVSIPDLFKRSSSISSDPTKDKKTFDELVAFLSTDPSYKGDQWKQLEFLNRFDGLDYDQKLHIIDIIEYDETH